MTANETTQGLMDIRTFQQKHASLPLCSHRIVLCNQVESEIHGLTKLLGLTSP